MVSRWIVFGGSTDGTRVADQCSDQGWRLAHHYNYQPSICWTCYCVCWNKGEQAPCIVGYTKKAATEWFDWLPHSWVANDPGTDWECSVWSASDAVCSWVLLAECLLGNLIYTLANSSQASRLRAFAVNGTGVPVGVVCICMCVE